MPKIPKTLLGRLKQYYSAAPRPASSYGNDVLNFAADRLGRIRRTENDLLDLDRYAMEQAARGKYNPDKLNSMARQIEANRYAAQNDFDEYMKPRYDAADRRAEARNAAMDQWLNYQRSYAKLARGNSLEDSEFDALRPYFGDLSADDVDTWELYSKQSPGELFDEINTYGAYPSISEPWMDEVPYPEGPTGEEYEEIVPDGGFGYRRSDFPQRFSRAYNAFRKANYAVPSNQDRIYYNVDPSDWRRSLENKRYK